MKFGWEVWFLAWNVEEKFTYVEKVYDLEKVYWKSLRIGKSLLEKFTNRKKFTEKVYTCWKSLLVGRRLHKKFTGRKKFTGMKFTQWKSLLGKFTNVEKSLRIGKSLPVSWLESLLIEKVDWESLLNGKVYPKAYWKVHSMVKVYSKFAGKFTSL